MIAELLTDADFDLTRAEGTSTLSGLNCNIQYHTVLAAFKHPSGAAVSIEQVRDLPNYVVCWRVSFHYMNSSFVNLSSFIEEDPELAWFELLRRAKIAYFKGPGRETIKKCETYKEEKANSREKAVTTRAENARTAQFEKGVPVFDAKQWKWYRHAEFNYPAFVLEFKAIANTCITIEDEASDGKWKVCRAFYSGGNFTGSSPLNDVVASDLTLAGAVEAVSKLADTDPRQWTRGTGAALLE